VSDAFTRLFDRRAATALDRQLDFTERLGDAAWRYELATGVLTLAGGVEYRAGLLGTESAREGVWLWGWANRGVALPAERLAAARALRAVGRRLGATELTEPRVAIGEVGGHALALLGVSLAGSAAYFRAPMEGGAAYLVLDDPAAPLEHPAPLLRVASVFPRAAATLPLSDHRAALAGYLGDYGFDPRPGADRLVAVDVDGRTRLTAAFEGPRLTRIVAECGPDEPDATLEPARGGDSRL